MNEQQMINEQTKINNHFRHTLMRERCVKNIVKAHAKKLKGYPATNMDMGKVLKEAQEMYDWITKE